MSIHAEAICVLLVGSPRNAAGYILLCIMLIFSICTQHSSHQFAQTAEPRAHTDFVLNAKPVLVDALFTCKAAIAVHISADD